MTTLHINLFITTALLAVLAGACRTATDNAKTRDDGKFTGQRLGLALAVVDGAVQVKPVNSGTPALATLRSLENTVERTGTLPTPKAQTWAALDTAGGPPLLRFEVGLLGDDYRCHTDDSQPVVAFNGVAALVCASSVAQTNELKAACAELAKDESVASFAAGQESCTCKRRRAKTLAYAGFLGDKDAFTAACRNETTVAALRNACLAIDKDHCPACKVEELSCECPGKIVLAYTKFTNDPEKFLEVCKQKIVDPAKPVATNFEHLEFEAECQERGGHPRIEDDRATACKCKGQRLSFTAWSEDRRRLDQVCGIVEE